MLQHLPAAFYFFISNSLAIADAIINSAPKVPDKPVSIDNWDLKLEEVTDPTEKESMLKRSLRGES